MVLLVAVGAGRRRALLLWSLVRTVLRSPDLIAMFLGHRRGVRGYLAISRGLIAIGAGDARAARKFADEAERIAPGEPLALLLHAQSRSWPATAPRPSAPSAPWRSATTPSCSACAASMSRRSAATTAWRRAATPRRRRRPRRRSAWAGQAVLEFRCAAGDWTGALAALDRNSRYGLIDKPGYRRQRAVLLTARALAVEETEPRSRAFARARSGEARARRWCRRRRWRRGCWASAATCEGRAASSRRRGRPIRIPISPTPMRICAPAIRRASGSRACSRWRRRRRAMSKARSRWRAPRSMRRNSRWRARRCGRCCGSRPSASPR